MRGRYRKEEYANYQKIGFFLISCLFLTSVILLVIGQSLLSVSVVGHFALTFIAIGFCRVMARKMRHYIENLTGRNEDVYKKMRREMENEFMVSKMMHHYQ